MSWPGQQLDNEIDLKWIPAFALNVSSRMKLSWFLNPEQSLRSNKGIARDYRGLAEQMGFQYNDIRNFQRSEDPTLKILEAWSLLGSHNTIGNLISFLENMDRYDIIEDITSQFKNDAIAYLNNSSTELEENPIQVAEVTSGPTESLNAITVSDIQTGELSYYDAYVCYAEEDVEFVKNLTKYLESNGLVLFIKGRDLLAGTSEPDAHIELIKERCKFVLIILSPAFLNTPECEWQISYAAGLAIEQRRRKLIPLLKSSCEIPGILKYVSLIDFTKPGQDWLLNKLVQSLRAPTNSMFVTSAVCMTSPKRERNLSLPTSSVNPIITFPPTINHPQVPPSPVVEVPSISSSSNASVAISQPQVNRVSPTNVKTHAKNKWYRNIKEKFSLNSTSSNTPPSLTSTATSGFYSHSGFELENSSDGKKHEDFIEDTV